MNYVTLRLSEAEYSIMQAHVFSCLNWCYAHFKHQKSTGIAPEIIVAGMYQDYFDKKLSEMKFPKSGKAFHFRYYEVKAYLEATCVVDDLPTKELRKMIETELNTWRISFTKGSMEDWYKSDVELSNIFGPFAELDDVAFEVIIGFYNRSIAQN
jgi:hypothetical protein